MRLISGVPKIGLLTPFTVTCRKFLEIQKKVTMPTIQLPHGNNEFNSEELEKYIRRTGRNYIIQGQQACRREFHTKPSSLDCWLRDNYAQYPDTKQAVNKVISDLVETGKFEEGKFICPDSKRIVKGIRIVE